MEVKIYIEHYMAMREKVIIILKHTQEKSYAATISDGIVVWVEIEEFVAERPPVFARFPHGEWSPVMTALVESLKNDGIVVEIDKAQRISAQAVSEERKEQIDYLRKQHNKILNRLI